MSLKILLAIGIAGAAIFAVSSGGLQKAKDFFKSTNPDKKPALEGGSQPARPEQSIDQMPLTDKERKTSETVNKIQDGLERFDTPDDLPRNTSDLSRFDNKLNSINAQDASAKLSPSEQKGAQYQRELAIPNQIKYSTSLAGSVPTTGQQIKREEPVTITNAKSVGGSSALQQKIILEQERAAKISETLYGNVQNPKFVKTEKPLTTTKTTTAKPTSLQTAQSQNNTSAYAKQLLAEARAKRK